MSSQNSDDNRLFVPLRFDPLKVMTIIMKSDPTGIRDGSKNPRDLEMCQLFKYRVLKLLVRSVLFSACNENFSRTAQDTIRFCL